MPDNDKPFLSLPDPDESDRSNLSGGPSEHKGRPTREQQIQRIPEKIEDLEDRFQDGNMVLSSLPDGLEPEQVLVMEISGSIPDFKNAIEEIDGLEYLQEQIQEFEPIPEYFSEQEKGTIYVVSHAQRGLEELGRLWNIYEEGEDWPTKQGRWEKLFDNLRDIRPWKKEDRVDRKSLTSILNELSEYELSKHYPIICELWYHNNGGRRDHAEETVKQLIEKEGGTILHSCVIEQIRYHAVKANAPLGLIREINQLEEIELLESEYLYSLRAGPQADLDHNHQFEDEELETAGDLEPSPEERPSSEKEPVLALLDGLPIQNHPLIRHHLRLDNPDDIDYSSAKRVHGTSVSSILVHGDLGNTDHTVLKEPIYHRPVLSINPRSGAEEFPEDELLVDLVFRSIRRMFESREDKEATADSVRIINISLGNEKRDVFGYPGPWARLLDYLSWEYNILFIVSAGNYTGSVEFEGELEERFEKHELAAKTDPNIHQEVLHGPFLEKLEDTNPMERRIISPAESINAVTVGALYSDANPVNELKGHLTYPVHDGTVAPYSRRGPGYNKVLKPELVMKGGRSLHRINLVDSSIVYPQNPPLNTGLKVAYPSSNSPVMETANVYGTSYASALASRLATRIYREVESWCEANSESYSEKQKIVLTKALLVHTSNWQEKIGLHQQLFGEEHGTNQQMFQKLSDYLGYGQPNQSRLQFLCDDNWATMIGAGELPPDQGHLYSIPLPAVLRGVDKLKRVTVTLAYNSPVNFRSQKYRGVDMFVKLDNDEDDRSRHIRDMLGLERVVHHRKIQHGTIKHEIWKGEKGRAFSFDQNFDFKVNCKKDAYTSAQIDHQPIPYGIAVTIEIAGGVLFPLYDGLRESIREQERVEVQP